MQGYCILDVHTIHSSEAWNLSTWAMLLPLAPALHEPAVQKPAQQLLTTLLIQEYF